MCTLLCRSFDAAGDGYGRCEGFGSIVLLPAAEAHAQPYAYIHGSSLNQVGTLSCVLDLPFPLHLLETMTTDDLGLLWGTTQHNEMHSARPSNI